MVKEDIDRVFINIFQVFNDGMLQFKDQELLLKYKSFFLFLFKILSSWVIKII